MTVFGEQTREARARITSGDVMVALARRYPSAEYALLPQVANGTGFAADRHADAIALSLWPSRGIRLHGFEIKVSRSDWTRELKKPDKAEAIASRCHHWWVAAAPGIVRLDELPPAWGLLELVGPSLRCVVQAPELAPPPIDLPFLAAILRKASNVKPGQEELEAARRAGHNEGSRLTADERRRARDHENATYALTTLEAQVAAFEEASGVKLGGWNAGVVGRAVATVLALDGDHGSPMRKIARMRTAAAEFLAQTADLMEPAT